MACEALEQLAEIRLSPKQVRRMVGQVGQARLVEREAAVEQLRTMPLPARRCGSQAAAAPELAVISMDGGRYQRRDHFGGTEGGASTEAQRTHWRETKVGVLLAMTSKVHDYDPMPQFPPWLATSTAVAELAKIAEKAPLSFAPALLDRTVEPDDLELLYDPPKLLRREVLASSSDAERFGWELESRAWQLGFPAAKRQAFIADGQTVNWTIAAKHFPRAEPILDLMHALSYAWSAAAAVGEGSYRPWAELIWQGNVGDVIASLTEHQQRLGAPPQEAQPGDPRRRVDRALTYYKNNQQRMDYPRYRRLGLPLCSSHIESTIKQINRRVKGTEKFWRRDTGEAVLQLRADTLSSSQPLTAFWTRWQANQDGGNCYHCAA